MAAAWYRAAMPKQLQSFDDGPALAEARTLIANAKEPCEWLFGMSPLNPQAGHAFLRDTIKRYAMHNAFTMTRVCTMARAGWDEAEIALRELIGEIMNRGDQLPTVLGAFAIELLDPRRPHHFSGPKKAGRFLQDICITVIVSRSRGTAPPEADAPAIAINETVGV